MPVLPQFDPENASYGRTAGAYIGAADEGQSMMARAQAMQIQQQQADQQKAEFQAKLPAIVANAQANVASAHASVVNATRMEQLRAKAALEAPGFNNEFLDAMQLADWDARSDALAALQPKVSYLSLFPEYKGFVDTVNNERVQSHASAITDAHLEEQQQIADDNRAARQETAQLMANSRTQVADTQAGARVQSAAIAGQSRENAATTSAQGRRDAAMQRANHQYELDHDIELRDESLRRGDRATAQLYQDHINKLNTSALSTSESVTPLPATAPAAPAPAEAAAPAAVSISIPGSDLPPSNESAAPASDASPAQAAVAPTKVDPKATTVNIGGKAYPIYKDAKGRRAYKVDGHYVPIDTQ